MRILLVEDDGKLLSILRDALERQQYCVNAAQDGREGLSLGRDYEFEFILLDAMLPGMDGFTVARELRKSNVTTKIIMLTSRDANADVVRGLDSGVVDLNARKLVDTWTTPDLTGNTALALDAKNERIFVAGRKPCLFYVFDRDGKVVSKQECVNINDDMIWESVLKRVYISGTQGLSIFHQETTNTYKPTANIPTNGGKSPFYVAQVHRLFVIHPKTDVDIAALLVYRVNPYRHHHANLWPRSCRSPNEERRLRRQSSGADR